MSRVPSIEGVLFTARMESRLDWATRWSPAGGAPVSDRDLGSLKPVQVCVPHAVIHRWRRNGGAKRCFVQGVDRATFLSTPFILQDAGHSRKHGSTTGQCESGMHIPRHVCSICEHEEANVAPPLAAAGKNSPDLDGESTETVSFRSKVFDTQLR